MQTCIGVHFLFTLLMINLQLTKYTKPVFKQKFLNLKPLFKNYFIFKSCSLKMILCKGNDTAIKMHGWMDE